MSTEDIDRKQLRDRLEAENERLREALERDDENGPIGSLASDKAEIRRLRAALREILWSPTAARGEDYGCLSLHEARTIARDALGETKA